MLRHALADPDRRADIVLACVVWVMAAAVLIAASRLPPPLYDPVGSAAIPQVVAVLAALCGLAIFLKAVRGAQPVRQEALEAPGETPAALSPGTAGLCILTIVAYVAVLGSGYVGFREATIPFVLLLGGALCRFEKRTLMLLALVAIVISFGFGWLFSEILYVDLPVTRWFAN